MRHAVVTGASGFLGQAVVTCLRERGWSVTPVSRTMLPGMHRVTDYTQTPCAADIVIHLAEEADRAQANRLGEQYLAQTSEVIRHLASQGSPLLYASSGVVYGDQGIQPFTIDSPVMPSDAYARAKVHNEALVLQARGTVVRLSNLYGYGMSPHNVMSDIARQIPDHPASPTPLRVRDDGPVRDFIWVMDAAHAIAMAAEQQALGIFNVGSGIGTSIRDLAQIALKAVGEEDRAIEATAPSTRPSVNVLNIDHTCRQLAWMPELPLPDRLLQFFRSGASHANS